ncbi:DUF969 domain-containing protein [Sphingobium phenoxybenzoativorans]|uniref:DUF969 domain-containing protein n=1 Tax=Sphingobium phenoxybenzoativorans TaxID=1592790 RepID=A0A975K8K0_9SPHN|nr:DUF969 domain-containing protein [Sphingobium phenoxybenzoativorans]QUT06795.1 DUF969 domain-containing protein [Sphingobium phenoxybenzoativorans]
MLVLSGIAVIILGFILRLNAMLVVACAALVTGLAAGLDIIATIERLGAAVRDSRFIAVVWLILPMIGLLERAGLQEQAARLITGLKRVTAGRVLFAYFLLRQGTAALGLTSLGGHVQMVRPLVAPMTEAAAERQLPLDPALRYKLRAHAAAVDNVALFFGEDIFIAIGSILLMLSFLSNYGIVLTPVSLGLHAIPTAIAALLVHGMRLQMLDRRLSRLARIGA